ncbi:MAG: GntR family transcriptional regulator [Kiloniellales bacterium]|nr:GntR family transcriptional regulator [Kiloniellales bacterium]
MKRHELDRNKVGLAYARIKELVVNYRFGPGGHLQINELSEQLNVSVTPVREALSRLHAEGLIASVPHRGFFTKNLDVKELRDLHELALIVLSHSLRLAAQDPSKLRSIQGFEDALSVLPSSKEQGLVYATYIEHLFETIAGVSENDEMISIISNFNNKSHFIRVIDLEIRGNLKMILEELSGLVSLLHAGNVAAAIDSLQRQFGKKQARMADLVKEALARIYISAATPEETYAADPYGMRSAATN